MVRQRARTTALDLLRRSPSGAVTCRARFSGIPISDPTRRALTLAREVILDSEPAWAREKWVEPVNLHITTLFLGEITDQALADAADAASGAVADMAPFLVSIDTVRAVPSPHAASMLWAVPSVASDPVSEGRFTSGIGMRPLPATGT